MSEWVEITSPTPVLNTPDFSFAFGGKSGREIPLDERGLPYFFEFVALKGTCFAIEEKCSAFISRVSCTSYSYPPLYLDHRFVKPKGNTAHCSLPQKDVLLERMRALLGAPYVWGGNWSRGIEEMLECYPPKGPIDEKTRILWTLRGVDCSGLLYEASEGTTPRNTSQLIHFGNPVVVNEEGILPALQPMDMIVYPGHVLFVLDKTHLIESRFPFGVIKSKIEQRLAEIIRERTLADEWSSDLNPASHFVIRRFADAARR